MVLHVDHLKAVEAAVQAMVDRGCYTMTKNGRQQLAAQVLKELHEMP